MPDSLIIGENNGKYDAFDIIVYNDSLVDYPFIKRYELLSKIKINKDIKFGIKKLVQTNDIKKLFPSDNVTFIFENSDYKSGRVNGLSYFRWLKNLNEQPVVFNIQKFNIPENASYSQKTIMANQWNLLLNNGIFSLIKQPVSIPAAFKPIVRFLRISSFEVRLSWPT